MTKTNDTNLCAKDLLTHPNPLMNHNPHDPHSKLHTQRLLLPQHRVTHDEDGGVLDQDGGHITLDLDDLCN